MFPHKLPFFFGDGEIGVEMRCRGGDRCRLSRGFSKIDPTCKFELQDHIILPSTYIYIDIDMYVYNMYICIYTSVYNM